MNHTINIPFEDVPRELIEQLNGCHFTYEEYLQVCPLYNNLPTYWNFAVFEDDDIVAFVWGIVEPLERVAHVLRISILPSCRKGNDKVFHYIHEVVIHACKHMGMRCVFGVTKKPEIFLKHRSEANQLRLSESKILEVRLHENLH